MQVIGLTGGIASGKSLVAEFFRELGVPIIDTDEIARQVVAPSHPAWRSLYATFGPAFFLPDGQVDRAALARHVFANPTARLRLEAITHPAIFAEVDRALAALRATPTPPSFALVAVPLLYEVGAEGRFDAIVVVYATREQQLIRMQQTRGYSIAEAEARLSAQLPLDDKVARANYVIDNSGDIEDTRRQVIDLARRLAVSFS